MKNKFSLSAFTLILIAASLGACSGPAPHTEFISNLMPLCGNTYAGEVVSTDAVDADWRAEDIIVGPIVCEPAAIKMPLAVGENRSRTWVLIPEKRTLTLKHDHRHGDGSPDAVSWYGGMAKTAGTAARQEFPVDDFSIELFKKEGLAASVVNTWAMEIDPIQTLAYELSRPATPEQKAAEEAGRFFRIEFDLNSRVSPDTPTLRFHWAAEPNNSGAFLDEDENRNELAIESSPFLNESCLASLTASDHPTTKAAILNYTLSESCSKIFGVETSQNIGRRMAIFLDGAVVSSPTVNAEINSGSGFIDLGDQRRYAEHIAERFNLSKPDAP